MILTFTLTLSSHYILESDEPWKASFEVEEDMPLADFHLAIQNAVNFDNDHLFEFFVARSEKSTNRTVFNDDIDNLDQTIGSLFPLPKGFRFFYLFDFGDWWLFRISKSRKKPRAPEAGVSYPRVIKETGTKPVQYPDYEDAGWDNENEFSPCEPSPLPDVEKAFDKPIMRQKAGGVFQASGFLLAVFSAPEHIMPSAWLPAVFGQDELPEFASIQDTQEITSALTALWNHWAETVGNDFGLPPECVLDEHGKPSLPLQAFSQGYLHGATWVHELWDDVFASLNFPGDGEDLEDDDIMLDFPVMFGLTLENCLRFSNASGELPKDSLSIAEDFMDEGGNIDIAFDIFPFILEKVAIFGREMGYEAPTANFSPAAPLVNTPKVGRNDPCPCGSGKKYKKCCLH